MRRIVHHLRQLSVKQKRDVLHISTFIFVVILLMVWVYTLGQSFGDPDTETRMKESLKPFNNLKESIVDSYDNLFE